MARAKRPDTFDVIHARVKARIEGEKENQRVREASATADMLRRARRVERVLKRGGFKDVEITEHDQVSATILLRSPDKGLLFTLDVGRESYATKSAKETIQVKSGVIWQVTGRFSPAQCQTDNLVELITNILDNYYSKLLA